jgi:hypothetical protein
MIELWSGADDGVECEPGHGCNGRTGEARLLRGILVVVSLVALNPGANQILKTQMPKLFG